MDEWGAFNELRRKQVDILPIHEGPDGKLDPMHKLMVEQFRATLNVLASKTIQAYANEARAEVLLKTPKKPEVKPEQNPTEKVEGPTGTDRLDKLWEAGLNAVRADN
jgi:hypothetical protein